MSAAISYLKFPFHLKGHQLEAVDAWISAGMRGSIIYSSGTGKTEIAFECARRAADITPYDAEHPVSFSHDSPLDILLLVPRIVLITQNLKRLLRYGITQEKIGVYFGERKEIKEITISTYQSVIYNPGLIRESKMVIFDEVHLVSDTAKVLRKIFDIAVEDPHKALLGLTATINEKDPKYNTIITVLPPVKKYMLKKYDANSMSLLLRKGGFVGGLARAWFLNVRKRKLLLSCADNKISAVVGLIQKRHPNQKVMVFSETLDSINKLKTTLESEGIRSMLIDSTINSTDRQKILSSWGKDFYALLSVHTLEIGFDVPEVGIELILATTSNMNQVIQRIGRVVRKYEGKKKALIYVVYVSETRDDNILEIFRKAVELGGRTTVGERAEDKVGIKENEEMRIKEAYNILEINSYEPIIVEADHEQKLFQVRSRKEKDIFYDVNAERKICSCPDFKFRTLKCKHILAAEIINSSSPSSLFSSSSTTS